MRNTQNIPNEKENNSPWEGNSYIKAPQNWSGIFLPLFFPKWLALKEKLRTNIVTPFASPLCIGSESPEVRRYSTSNFTNTGSGKVQEKVKH